MDWFSEFCPFFQAFDVAQIGHPSVDVLQIEHLENRVVSHIFVERIHDSALLDDRVSDVLPLLKHRLGREADPRRLQLVRLQLATTKFQARIRLQLRIHLFLGIGAKPKFVVSSTIYCMGRTFGLPSNPIVAINWIPTLSK